MSTCFALVVIMVKPALSYSLLNDYKPPLFDDPNRAKNVSATYDTVNKMYENYFKEEGVPGLAFGVVLDGYFMYSGAFGYSNIARKIKATPKSLFRVASMTKSVTAVAILQLRDAGKINLDDPLVKYLPQANRFEYLTIDCPPITIRQLLMHSAGFPEDNPWGDWQLAMTKHDWNNFLSDGISFSNVQNVEYEYSNLGYALLGQVVENVSKMSFEDYITINILNPLNMEVTVMDFSKAYISDIAQGYSNDLAQKRIPFQENGVFGAMGGLISSIEDFSKYMIFHLSAWPARNNNDNDVLKRGSLREMHKPWNVYSIYQDASYSSFFAYTYGMRWVKEGNGVAWVTHSGGLPGFGSNWMISPELGLAVVSFNNHTYGNAYDINKEVFKYIISAAELRVRESIPSKYLQNKKDALLVFIPGWNGAEYAKIFADNFFKDNELSELVKDTEDIFSKAGKIINIGELTPINQLRATFLIKCETSDIKVFFSLSPEKDPLIQQIVFTLIPHGNS